ncbi:hypothetical protein MNBD_BACTEROID07-1476 [hydrothermal vent metagenome]|uniref:Histidine kinase domain-containing protein n=1 Tax=hydrothermal vent metagenome TaxID=652676 RepID=A0A3B0UYM9_9ZZZZ
MKRSLKIFILFLFIVFSNSVTARVKWESLKTPARAKLIIGGNSLTNFWILDEENNILHNVRGKWTVYPFNKLFSVTHFRSYFPILVEGNRLFIFLTDTDWKTHIAEIRNGKIIYYAFVTSAPLYRITRVSNTLYATGNFGIILKLQDGHWIQLPSPIHSHIHSAAADKRGTLWLGTNNEGVFSWNGKEFHHFNHPVKITKVPVNRIKIIRDTLYINTSKGVSYKLYNGIFHPVPPQRTPFTSTVKLMHNGYYKIVSNNGNVRYIPYLYKIKSFKELRDGHALLLTQSHQLFFDHHVTGNFFLDFASRLGLEGPKYSYTPINTEPEVAKNSLYLKLRPGIIFSDFNNDFYQDILLFNVSDERHPYLYLNNQSHYFNNFAGPLGLNKFTFNGFFSYAFDLNGDNIPEIISPDFRNRNYYLNIVEKSAGKYQLSASIPMPKEYAVNPLQYLSFTDIDKDGDLDIALVFGYSESGKGSIIFLKNNSYGNFSVPDTTLADVFRGWNVQTIFADFNNDGLDDVAVCRNWGANVIYFQDKNSGWSARRLPSPKNFRSQQRKSGIVAFDYDNDGDLDIVMLAEQPFIRILQNDGKGNFTDITQKSGLNILNTGKKSGQITAGDFDNNGFIDLFITVHTENKWKNFIFLNDSSHRFVDESENLGISNGKVEFVATGDIDNDGDLDLYGFRQGSNVLWLNNLNSTNYLRFRLTGIKSNSAAIGAKIWLYEAGHLGNSNYLSGYRQTGSKLTGWGYQNERIVHFGVNDKKKYDVRIVFPTGKTKILKNLLPGRTIHVTEISAPVSWFYLADHKAHVLLRDKEFLSYLLVIILGLFFLMFTIQYGTKKFRWDVRLTTIIVSLNLIIFAILLFVLYRNETGMKYYLPLAVILFGSFGPLGFFLWIKRFTGLKSEKENDYALFQALQNFAHGAWAASNLNSLQLFFENMSMDDLRDNDFLQPFEKRKETFFNLTLPVINEIISLSEKSNKNRELLPEIINNKNGLVRFLSSDFSHMRSLDNEHLSTAIMKLREALSLLKNMIFAGNSCYPSLILNNLREELENLTSSNNIDLKIINFLSGEDAVLMDATSLANILDNCIQNSRKAMAENPEKKMTIKFIKADPRIFIEITDNGKGIPEGEQEKIFENGYSSTHSTGYGLFYAKETLKKYGGRIYVKNSVPHQRTTFVIELQKGSKK